MGWIDEFGDWLVEFVDDVAATVVAVFLLAAGALGVVALAKLVVCYVIAGCGG